MRKVIIFWIFIFLVVLSGALWLRSCNNTMQARWDLDREINTYHNETSEKAAEIAFRLAESFLDDESKGAFRQRLKSLRNPGTTFGFHLPNDSFDKVMWDLIDELGRWVDKELGYAGTLETRSALIRDKTPCLQITDLRRASQEFVSLSYSLTLSDDKPSSVKAVNEVRAEFVEAKSKMENLLARSKS